MAELKAGDPAPDFETVNDQNEKVKLSDMRGKRVVLYFYPKDDTPGCTTQACSFRDSYASVTGNNAVVLGVSTDSVESHQAFKAKNELPFPLLVDPDHSIAESYGVWGLRKMGDREWMGVNRSQFIVDEDGKLMDVVYGVKPDESVELAEKALNGAKA